MVRKAKETVIKKDLWAGNMYGQNEQTLYICCAEQPVATAITMWLHKFDIIQAKTYIGEWWVQ